MEGTSKSMEDISDPDFFDNIKADIEKQLDKMKKIVNNINQMRVEAAYLQSDLILMIDAHTWEEISELIGLQTSSMTMNSLTDTEDKK
ncbi:unnamed protein product [Spodoptera exigua]|uniref:Uncharacterized protein n=1 Tax=Spodoptera exigua TaxID=7107 RepID=A0A922MTQ1_SPOEX|nr:hypothetical protein HF086_011156 [Spodoptera exigua]CAH0678111.1 unnamed protein product [Spodoptera exigua]